MTQDIEALIARVALRDRSAFAELYRKTSPKLFAVCLRILIDRAEAEEALQEVYVKIWQRADRFAIGRAGGMTWLSAIARNHAIDVIRARKPVARDIDDAIAVADPSRNPEEAALAASEGRRIEDCLQELPEDRAQAVLKAYVEGLSYEELARHYGVPLNTMRTWLRRSLIKLRECLER